MTLDSRGRAPRQIRAAYTRDTITVYQAYSPHIALPSTNGSSPSTTSRRPPAPSTAGSAADDRAAAHELLPNEKPYPVPEEAATAIGASY